MKDESKGQVSSHIKLLAPLNVMTWRRTGQYLHIGLPLLLWSFSGSWCRSYFNILKDICCMAASDSLEEIKPDVSKEFNCVDTSNIGLIWPMIFATQS
jgi:hypothetical protein